MMKWFFIMRSRLHFQLVPLVLLMTMLAVVQAGDIWRRRGNLYSRLGPRTLSTLMCYGKTQFCLSLKAFIPLRRASSRNVRSSATRIWCRLLHSISLKDCCSQAGKICPYIPKFSMEQYLQFEDRTGSYRQDKQSKAIQFQGRSQQSWKLQRSPPLLPEC